MPFCPDCGVELEPGALICPLCMKPILPPVEPHPVRLVEELIDVSSGEGLTRNELRLVAWEVLSVSAAIIAISVCAINLLLDRGLTWALYPLDALGFIWLLATSWRFLRARLPLFFSSAALLVPLFLIALDFADGKASWSFSIALPISLIFEAALSISVWLFSNIRGRGANVIALVLLLLAVVCIGIETTLDIAAGKWPALQWSAIVSFCLLPAAVFFFYLHYRISKKTTLRRFFRL